ncbi:YceG family protein [Alkaliphilus hydrothermalis]|uniref:Putative component of 'biosynthetic module' domain-containing protein n=1 Tax=Alkaliphilus hydrothermalis TaxID=1482730 RepID=A0ABS2NNF5_9FIRM|nr:YceG family protein [Alkaliphilus hydrothermalis]MBM7614391.1 hypothetical protein [Alkaliphilus hydrothermalis]
MVESTGGEKKKRQETVAYRASLEIDKILHQGESGIYRPWQLENYKVVTNTLTTTYDEFLILWWEEARFREGFKVEDNQIYLPNIFAKINGTTSDINLYWKQINNLIEEQESIIFIKRIPFTMSNLSKKHLSYSHVFDGNGNLNLDKVKELKEYKMQYLRTSVQNLILYKLNELISTDGLFIWPMEMEFKSRILDTILNLNQSYLELIQKFDYPYHIPKLLIYNGDEGGFTKEDFIILAFLHLVGFDIGIFTPTGFNNIENGIDPSYYDIHKLERLDFNIELSNTLNQTVEAKEKTNRLKRSFLWFFQ